VREENPLVNDTQLRGRNRKSRKQKAGAEGPAHPIAMLIVAAPFGAVGY